jgi:hypothetical protein
MVQDRKIANPSAALLKAALIHTAYDMYPGEFGEVGAAKGQELLTHRPNNDEGFGRVDMDKATNLGSAIIVDENAGVATGEDHTYPVKVTGASAHLRATLVYTDAPASENAAKALVNDLDLSVVDANGKVTTLDDHLNNTEMIEMPVAAGNYEVHVKGNNVPQGAAAGGKQAYAIIMSVE